MKNLKKVGIALVASIVTLLASCSNALLEQKDEDVYGTIMISNGSESRYFNNMSVSSASVTVCGKGMATVSTDKDVEIKNAKGELQEISGIVAGKNRVVSVQAKHVVDGVAVAIDGVVIRAVTDVKPLKNGPTQVAVNWSTTALGNVFYELIQNKFSELDTITQDQVKAYLPVDAKGAVLDPSVIDAAAIAKDIKAGHSSDSVDKSEYVKKTFKLTFTTNVSSVEEGDIAVWVNDHNSRMLTTVNNGVNEIAGIAPGTWTLFFNFAGKEVLQKSIEFTKDYVLEEPINLGSVAPRLEDESGDSIKVENMPLDNKSAVYLCARAGDSDKVLLGYDYYYTTDGSTPVYSENAAECSAKYNPETGIILTKNTVIKAISKYSDLAPSTVSTFQVNVRCASPVVTDETGKEYKTEDLNFTEVTTVYLKGDEGSTFKYYVGNSKTPVDYDAEKGIVLSEKQTITAIAQSENAEESKPVTFGVNVVLPIGDLKLMGTVGQEHRFIEDNLITITCPVEGATILYTTDGTDPVYDEEFGENNGTVYQEAFKILTTSTIKAIAHKDGWSDSPMVTAVFTKAEKLNTPVISSTDDKTLFASYTTISLSYAKKELETPKIYYSFDKDASLAQIVEEGELYKAPFEIQETTLVRAVAVMDEDWANSDIAEVQFTKAENVEKLTFSASPAMNISEYKAFVQMWAEGEKDAPFTPVNVVNAAKGVVSFEMSTTKSAFLVVLCTPETNTPDWYAIKSNPGRIYYQTNMNGIVYTEGNLNYTGAFGNGSKDGTMYEPDEKVKTPELKIDEAKKQITLSCITPSSVIYYTLDGKDPVDEGGSPLASAIKYTEPFVIDSSVTTVKAVAVRTGYTTSDLKIHSTIGANDFIVYIGVPKTIVLPDEDDKTKTRDLTVTGMKIAFNGNGYSWKEIVLEKCQSSTSSILWFKGKTEMNYKDGTENSLTTYQTRIMVQGQTKEILYQHPYGINSDKDKYCIQGQNPQIRLNNDVLIIDATDFNNPKKVNFYTSDSPDTSAGTSKYYTQDFALIDDSLITFTDIDPNK